MKPERTCRNCQHSLKTMCLKDRLGWPFVGDWCAAFAVVEVPHDKAVQTPESIPSRELDHETS